MYEASRCSPRDVPKTDSVLAPVLAMSHTSPFKEERQVDDQQQTRWPTRRQLLWAGATVGLLTIAILIGYRYGITLWDWIKLLVVPVVIAGGGLWFNVQQRAREKRIANERAQDEALQGYLDGMSQLLTDKEQPLHKSQPSDNLSTGARARTLTVLTKLDRYRKRSVLQFLYESRLIDQEQTLLDESGLIERRQNIVSLRETDLRGAFLLLSCIGKSISSILHSPGPIPLIGAELIRTPRPPCRPLCL
jgi:hypothetical protein